MRVLECELCDYLTNVKDRQMCKCGFTGQVFNGPKDFEQEEYPCRHSSYDEYLQKRHPMPEVYPAFDTDEKRVYTLLGNDWMMIYRRLHPLSLSRR